MKAKKITEALARLDGWKQVPALEGRVRWYKQSLNCRHLPDYSTDNEIDRLVRGLKNKMSDDEDVRYVDFLFEIVLGYEIDLKNMSYDELVALQRSTAAQKVEAFLKAHSKWGEAGRMSADDLRWHNHHAKVCKSMSEDRR